MTPRQIAAITMIAGEQIRMEQAERLSLNALAAQGSEDGLKKAHGELMRSDPW